MKSVKKFLSDTPKDEVCRLLQNLGIGIKVTACSNEQPKLLTNFTDGKDYDFDDYIPSNTPYDTEDLQVDTLPHPYDEKAIEIGGCQSEISKPSTFPVKYLGVKENGKANLQPLLMGNKHLYLNQCCVGQVHRAHLLLSNDMLWENHIQTWWNL